MILFCNDVDSCHVAANLFRSSDDLERFIPAVNHIVSKSRAQKMCNRAYKMLLNV